MAGRRGSDLRQRPSDVVGGGLVRNDLRRLGVRPSKQRGQHFLIDSGVVQAILNFASPRPDENILEIGPGLGALTRSLYELGSLTAIEIEESFCHELMGHYPKAKIIAADVRQVDFSSLGSNFLVFGNLPYVFSTEIVFHLIDQRRAVSRAILLLQREFAERMAADPGGRDYGALSVNCQLWADVELGPKVSGSAFHPQTQVESQVVQMRMRQTPRVEVPDQAWFRRVVQAAFFRRRKKVINSLTASGLFSEAQARMALEHSGIDPSRRAETVGIEEFALLTAALGEKKRA